MSALEQEIIEKFRQLEPKAQQRVLNALESFVDMRPLSATEIMQLPAEDRHRYVQSAIAASSNEDFEIFEAYSEEKIDD